MADNESTSPDPAEKAAIYRMVADLLGERFAALSDRCREALAVSWDGRRRRHPSESHCRAMVEEWRVEMNAFCRDLPKLLAELNKMLNRPPGKAHQMKIEAACRNIADRFEPLVLLSERWRAYRLIRRWRLAFLELTETNLSILEQVCALPREIRAALADRASVFGGIDIALKIDPPPNFPPSRVAEQVTALAAPPPICRSRARKRGVRDDFISDLVAAVLAILLLSPLLLVAFLMLWPFLALAAIIWTWLLLLGAASVVVAKFKPAPNTMAGLEKLAVAVSLVLLLLVVVWTGLKIDHFLVP